MCVINDEYKTFGFLVNPRCAGARRRFPQPGRARTGPSPTATIDTPEARVGLHGVTEERLRVA